MCFQRGVEDGEAIYINNSSHTPFQISLACSTTLVAQSLARRPSWNMVSDPGKDGPKTASSIWMTHKKVCSESSLKVNKQNGWVLHRGLGSGCSVCYGGGGGWGQGAGVVNSLARYSPLPCFLNTNRLPGIKGGIVLKDT